MTLDGPFAVVTLVTVVVTEPSAFLVTLVVVVMVSAGVLDTIETLAGRPPAVMVSPKEAGAVALLLSVFPGMVRDREVVVVVTAGPLPVEAWGIAGWLHLASAGDVKLPHSKATSATTARKRKLGGRMTSPNSMAFLGEPALVPRLP